MKQLVIFLEERSAKVMLDEFLPRVLPEGVSHRCIPFEGKQDLDKQIGHRLKGWLQPNTAFLILRDQESSNCLVLKESLQQKALVAGRPDTVIRIACHELESWYFGDLQSVGAALQIPKLHQHASSSKYRVPDKIVNPATELDKITHGRYQKVSGSREIGKRLTPSHNTSHSFQVFLKGIDKALASIPN